jgi:hypothetical protein
MMAEIQRININKQQTQQVFKKYTAAKEIELLSILGGESMVIPKNQQQHADSVAFDTKIVSEAKQQLLEEGVDTGTIEFTHNHNRLRHSFAFSQQDLATAQTLYETHGIDRMWLVMNGNTLSDGTMVQHRISANHEWELHTLEWKGWTGKVVSMYTDEKGQQKTIFSQSIQEAEEKELLIVALKEKLFEEPDLSGVVSIADILDKAA